MKTKNDAKIYEFLESKDFRIQPNGVIEKVAMFRDLKLGKGVTKPVWKPVGFHHNTGPKLVRYKRSFLMVKRIIWIHHFGGIKANETVIVKDGNEGNCHPDNLELITHNDIHLRIYRAGRKAANAKLTWNEAQEIRGKYNSGQYTQTKLGEQYGVSIPVVHNIVHNLSYKNKVNHEVAEAAPAEESTTGDILTPGKQNGAA